MEPGNGKYLPPLFQSLPCGNERPALQRSLDHETASAHAADDAVAARKIARYSRRAQWKFGNKSSLLS